MNKLLWKLLRKNISGAQLAGFALANLVGLSIVLMAVQFYQDVRPVFDDEDSFIRKDYMVISRAITGAGAMMGGNCEFSEEDISDIESQPWCRKVGRFVSSEFPIYATVGVGGGRGMGTELFFESIPTEFIDLNGAQWKFDPSHPEVPVIISREYLALYNFGFASAQGLPRVSEGQVGMVPIDFIFNGNGLNEKLQGRIVGFSNRLNTVVVPEEFMAWANNRYGKGSTRQPQRLIIEVNSPGDVKIERYMKDHRYEVAGDKGNANKTSFFLTLVVSLVITVGVVISLLSFFVLMLSIYLLLQKNIRRLRDLLLLGYSPEQVSRPYVLMVVAINVVVLLAAIVVMLLARAYYMPMLRAMDIQGSGVWLSLLVGLVIMGAITLGNVLAIRRKISSLWVQK